MHIHCTSHPLQITSTLHSNEYPGGVIITCTRTCICDPLSMTPHFLGIHIAATRNWSTYFELVHWDHFHAYYCTDDAMTEYANDCDPVPDCGQRSNLSKWQKYCWFQFEWMSLWWECLASGHCDDGDGRECSYCSPSSTSIWYWDCDYWRDRALSLFGDLALVMMVKWR